MKKYTILLSLVTIIGLSSCKKSVDTTTTTPPSTLPGSPTLSNASGACYALVIDALLDNGSGGYDTTTINTPIAWFESTSQSVDAGTCSVNTAPLVLKDTFLGIPIANQWYSIRNDYSFNGGTPLAFKQTSSIVWKASGNASTGVPAINYSDNNPWGKITNFVVPKTLTMSSTLNITFSFSNATGNDQLFYLIKGSKGQKTGTLANNATTLSIGSGELAGLTEKGDQLEVELIPIKVASSTISGKTYYFVKEYCINKYVNMQ